MVGLQRAMRRGGAVGGRPRRLLVHSLRLALFAGVIALVYAHGQQRLESRSTGRLDVSPQRLEPIFGQAATLGEPVAEGMLPVFASKSQLDAPSRTPLGYVIQTSPASDHIIGFSGPTNVLIAMDAEERVVGLQILASDDTQEHVEQVEKEEQFLRRFNGLTREEVGQLRQVDGVSGATLTSLAIAESVIYRLRGGSTSLKFPDPPQVDDIHSLFPAAVRLEPASTDPALSVVLGEDGAVQGRLLRTSPAADNIVGYQGPTETYIGLDPENRVTGIVIGRSYDNEPYVGYVRDDYSFPALFQERSLEELAQLDLAAAGIEGVSGATMTSVAVAEGLVAAADRHQRRLAAAAAPQPSAIRVTARDVGTIAVVAFGVLLGMTSLRRRRVLRFGFQCVLIGYLGLVNGDLLSQALLVGWAQHGIPWRTMLGPAILTIAAFTLPIATKQNVYCHQICPHGAAQQLLRGRLPWRVHLPRSVDRLLGTIPATLLVLVVATALGAFSVSLVDIEPFDAYLIRIAGAATIIIAVVGLVASLFVPMAYCRYGCPTGALLNYVRLHGRSGELGTRDAVAVGCLGLALALYLHA